VLNLYAYGAWGEVRAQDVTIPNPYGYTGREFAEDGLYYYRARLLDPQQGRFIAEDPIGQSLGVNLYRYVENDPLNWIDPFGWHTVVVLPTWIPTSQTITQAINNVFQSINSLLGLPGLPDYNAIYPKWYLTLNDWFMPVNLSMGSTKPDPNRPECGNGCPEIAPGAYDFTSDMFPHNLTYPGQQRYRALDLNTVPSIAPNPNNPNNLSIIEGVWIHRGGLNGTSSEGCLTIYPPDYPSFMQNFPRWSTGTVIVLR